MKQLFIKNKNLIKYYLLSLTILTSFLSYSVVYGSSQTKQAGSSMEISIGGRYWNISSPTSGSFASFVSFSNVFASYNYGFIIPIGSTITGVVVEATKSGASAVMDTYAQLIKTGAVVGNNKNSAIPWSSGLKITYGSNTDLWGLTLTPDYVNSADFGFGIAGNNAGGWAYLDSINGITIYYTDPVPNTLGLPDNAVLDVMAMISNQIKSLWKLIVIAIGLPLGFYVTRKLLEIYVNK